MANLSGTYTSPYTSPTFKYDVSYRETKRTSSSVTYNVTVAAYMTSSQSFFGYALNCYVNIGGKQELVFAKDNTRWTGTTKHTFSKTVTCSTNSSSGTVSARMWTTTPNSPGQSGQIDISGTFNKSASSEDGEGTTPPPTPGTGGYIFKRVAGTWKDYCDIGGISKRTGGSWEDAVVMRRVSGKWIQIYPGVTSGGGGGSGDGGTSTDGHIIISGGSHKYKNKYNSWQSGTARQGSWSSYGSYYGVFGINRTQFTGNGAVTKVTSAYITGKRNASGYYNNNQTINFYRSNNSGSGTSIGYSGQFTATTGAPGADKWMSGNRTISGLDNVRDFLNGVSGYNHLMIYSASTSDYLGLSETKLAVEYEYKPVVAVFDNPKKAMELSEEQLRHEAMTNPYLTLLLYPDEVHLSLEEIFKRRTLLNRPDIENKTLNPITSESLPYSKEFKVQNGKLTVELYNIFENREAQYSFDGVVWSELKFSPITTLYEGEVKEQYENIYVRVIDISRDELLYQHKYDKPRLILL